MGERDSYCQIHICKLPFETFCKSVQASRNHEVNRPDLVFIFSVLTCKTVKIQMWLRVEITLSD